jgi:hypothetical protein
MGKIHQLFIDFKKAYDSVRREVLYNILVEFGIFMKLIRFIEIYLNETCSKILKGKHLPDAFPIQDDLNQVDALLQFLSNFALECAIRKVKGNKD